MELAVITPTSYLNKFSKQGDFYLALAHLIDDNAENDYASFHRREARQGKKIVLDNGLFEGAQVEPEALIRKGRLIGAQVVCAPDVLYNSKETVREFKRFIRLKHELGFVSQVMGIPQADNPTDWWECFQFMDLHKECDLIGLSILSVTQSFKRIAKGAEKQPITASRAHIIKQLSTYQSLSGRDLTKIHLLGMGENHGDVISAIKYLPNTIISNDTSGPFIHGSKEIAYDRFGYLSNGKDPEKVNFDLKKDSLTEAQEACVQKNINTMLDIRRRNWN